MKEQLNTLKETSKSLEVLIQKLETNKATSRPEGNILITKKNGKTSFYRRFDNSSQLKYLNKSQMQLISELAQKRYLLQVCNMAKAKKKAIDKCIRILNTAEALFDLSSVYVNFPPELKGYIKPIKPNAEYVRKWQAINFEKNTFPVKTNLVTKRGELVRSKSELIIANKLYDAGIPYHYETMFMKEDFRVSPDFFILNPRTLQTFYWEHFGLLSKESYLEEALWKIDQYAKYGVIQGKNLILTYESETHQLSTNYVETLITTFLK
jgi:hypothetical protein